MSNHLAGTEGVIKVAANAVAEMRGWSIEQQADVVEDTVLGDTWKTNKPSLKSWTATFNGWWDETDATGQALLIVGAELSLGFYPEGATAGDIAYTGSGIVTSFTNKGEVGGMIEAEFSVTGNGALATGAV